MQQAVLLVQLLTLLAVANGTPVIATKLLGRERAIPLDRNATLSDGRPSVRFILDAMGRHTVRRAHDYLRAACWPRVGGGGHRRGGGYDWRPLLKLRETKARDVSEQQIHRVGPDP